MPVLLPALFFSINYAQMIYCLYWNKFYKPKQFWKSVIKSVKGYYRDWVYIRKALDYGLKFKGIENCSPFYHLIYTGYWLNKDFVSRCYLRKLNTQSEINTHLDLSINKHYKQNELIENNNEDHDENNESGDIVETKHDYKYNTMYEFRGIIAGQGSISTRYKRYQMVITLGYDNDKFIELHLNKKRDLSKFKQIVGKGFWIDGPTPHIVVTKMTLM